MTTKCDGHVTLVTFRNGGKYLVAMSEKISQINQNLWKLWLVRQGYPHFRARWITAVVLGLLIFKSEHMNITTFLSLNVNYVNIFWSESMAATLLFIKLSLNAISFLQFILFLVWMQDWHRLFLIKSTNKSELRVKHADFSQLSQEINF